MSLEDEAVRSDQGDEASGKSLGEEDSQQVATEGYFQKVEMGGKTS